MTNFLMVKKMSDILEHTRMTEFKLESVELNLDNIIPLGCTFERIQASKDKKRIKVFYCEGEKSKLMLPKENEE